MRAFTVSIFSHNQPSLYQIECLVFLDPIRNYGHTSPLRPIVLKTGNVSTEISIMW